MIGLVEELHILAMQHRCFIIIRASLQGNLQGIQWQMNHMTAQSNLFLTEFLWRQEKEN